MSFHDFEMTAATGETVPFDTFKGRRVLVVNVASH